MKNIYFREKALGMLLGLHVGDSLGATLEFQDPRSMDNLHTEIIGGGHLGWNPGDPTDDTEMMILILESMVENKGRVNIQDIANKFVCWMDSGPQDIGGTVREALTRIKRGESPFNSGLSTEYSQANGSLMRCAPLALIDSTIDGIINQCSITHAHENCIACDLVFVNALKGLLNGDSKQTTYRRALELSRELSSELYETLERLPDMNLEDIYCEGYVIDTLAFAFWGLLNTDSFEEALIMIVNRGGDADTLGAVCGALCGAHYGPESIPERWLNAIQEKERIQNLLKELI